MLAGQLTDGVKVATRTQQRIDRRARGVLRERLRFPRVGDDRGVHGRPISGQRGCLEQAKERKTDGEREEEERQRGGVKSTWLPGDARLSATAGCISIELSTPSIPPTCCALPCCVAMLPCVSRKFNAGQTMFPIRRDTPAAESTGFRAKSRPREDRSGNQSFSTRLKFHDTRNGRSREQNFDRGGQCTEPNKTRSEI